MANDEIQNLLKLGIQTARNGNKIVARGIFEQVIKEDPQNEQAWMWLAAVLDQPAERLKALQKVLSINPNNERAKQALAKLDARPAVPVAPPPPEPVPTAPTPVRPPSQRNVVVEAPAPEPVLAAAPPRRGGGISTPLYILIAIIGLAFIVAAVFLLLQQVNKEEAAPTATAFVEAPLAFPTFTLAPSDTPAPVILVQPGNRPNLGATWTPIPSRTPLPSPTATAELPDVGVYQLVFTNQENPAARRQLQLMSGDGENVSSIEINLAIEPSEPVTDEATAEPTAEATAEAASTTFDQVEFFDAAFSPDGTEIVFTAQISAEVQELFIVSVQGGRPRQLTDLGAAITEGAIWSLDGERILFASDADGDLDIYQIPVDGGDPANLTDNVFIDREPVLAPDGSVLVIASDRATPGETELWAIPLGNGEPNQLTDDYNSSFSPTFSPDGTRIAFISNRSSDNDLYVMNADGTNEQLLTTDDDNADDRYPAFSPDGHWIALSSDRADGRVLQLWLVRSDGTDEWRQLTEGRGASREANWHLLE